LPRDIVKKREAGADAIYSLQAEERWKKGCTMKITDHIHAIKIPFKIPVAPGKSIGRFVYSYLVTGADVCLIDSGVADAHEVIFDSLSRLDRTPEDIGMLLLTHSHPDHIGAAAKIKKRTGCAVLAHPLARPWIEDIDLQFGQRPVPGFHTLVGGSLSIDGLLEDRQILDAGGISLKVYYTPGHSRDSVSLYCPSEGVMFAGDAVPQENDMPIYEDAGALVLSLRTLRNISGIRHLLASWRHPKKDEDPYAILDEGVAHVNRIHRGVREITNNEAGMAPMQLCRKMVERLGLPETAINPIVAGSFASHMQYLDQPELP